MLRSTILLFCVFAFVTVAWGQKAKEYIKLGEAAEAEEDRAEALFYFEKAYLIDSANFDFGVKYAEALRHTRDFEGAKRLYAKLYAKDKGKLFSQGLFWLATMQKMTGEYKEAMRNFKKAQKQHLKDKQGYPYRKCQQEIASCTFAINARFDTSEVIFTRPVDVNGEESELSPFYGNDRILWFASYPNAQTDSRIAVRWATEGDSTEFTASEEISGFPEGGHNANLTFHPDGKRVYFTHTPSGNDSHIWTGLLSEGSLTEAATVDGLGQCGRQTMPHFATIRGKGVLFFASDCSGGKGKFDIYWAEALTETQFETPVNAGPEINTEDNELAPFYHDGRLYFSGEWHEGYGGLDIFFSPGEPRNFEKPENVGPPFNSPLNDLYFTYNTNHKNGWMASNRPNPDSEDGTACCNDLYRFWYRDSLLTEETENPYASLASLNKYLPVTLYFHNDEPNPRTRDTISSVTYGRSYNDYLSLRGLYEKEMTRGLSRDAEEEALFEVEEFFDLIVSKGMSDLEKFSTLLLAELQKGTHVTLMVKGFASPRAKSDYNLLLTKRRISSLEKYLKSWKNEALQPYFSKNAADGGTLRVTSVPFGEYRADQNVSDEQGGEKESIFSRGARLERKIEIQSVQRNRAEDGPCLDSPAFALDLGLIARVDTLSLSFTMKNCGADTLYLSTIDAPCHCTLAKADFERLAPGMTGTVKAIFTPADIAGIFSRTVKLFFVGYPEPRELTIMGEVGDE